MTWRDSRRTGRIKEPSRGVRPDPFFLVLMGLAVMVWGAGAARAEAMDGPQGLSLTMDNAIERTLAASERIKIRQAEIEKNRHTYTKVRSNALPQLTGDLLWDRYIKSPALTVDFGDGVQEFKTKQNYDVSAGASLTQILFAFGKVSTAIDIAKDYIDLEKLAFETTKRDLIFIVKQAYFTILYAEGVLKIAEESYSNALQNQKALRDRFQGGRVSKAENAKMAADVERRIPTKLNAKNQLNSLLIEFRILIGAEPGTPIRLTNTLTRGARSYSLPEAQEKMVQSEPSLLLLSKDTSIKNRMIKLRRADYFPELSAHARYAYAGNGPDTYPQDQMTPSLFAGVMMNVPIWDSGSRRGAYEESKVEREIAGLTYDKRKKELTKTLSTAISEHESLKDVHRAQLKALRWAEDSYQITFASFKSGAANQTQVNDAELQWTLAKLSATESLFQLNVLEVRIDQLTGEGTAR